MSTHPDPITRRAFLGGARPRRSEAPDGGHCVSSAVVTLLPGREAEVTSRLEAMEGVEVRGGDGRKLVVLLEGPGSGAVGSLLVAISTLEGVVSANMVFEHSEPDAARGA